MRNEPTPPAGSRRNVAASTVYEVSGVLEGLALLADLAGRENVAGWARVLSTALRYAAVLLEQPSRR